MKKIRTADFDPNATPELGSPLDGMPSITRPAEQPPNAKTPLVTTDVAAADLPSVPTSADIDQPTAQSIDKSTSQSTDRLTDLPSGRVGGRAKAFYITERLDRRLDEAVQYFKSKNINKVDRSTVVNAMLDQEEQFKEESLERLVDRVVGQLASRLTD
jgi:hypothetical protein